MKTKTKSISQPYAEGFIFESNNVIESSEEFDWSLIASYSADRVAISRNNKSKHSSFAHIENCDAMLFLFARALDTTFKFNYYYYLLSIYIYNKISAFYLSTFRHI